MYLLHVNLHILWNVNTVTAHFIWGALESNKNIIPKSVDMNNRILVFVQ